MHKVLIVHLPNEDPILAEVEEMPLPTDNFVTLLNPRRRDGKAVHYLNSGATSIILPWHRITFIEVMVGDGDRSEIVEFFRENR